MSKTAILACYEKAASGETKATENILKSLNKTGLFKIVGRSVNAQKNSRLLATLFWNLNSLLIWFSFLNTHKDCRLIYTTTYTAGVAASILNNIYKFRICFHYHGTRVPVKPNGLGFTTTKTRLTQAIKYQLVLMMHRYFLSKVDTVITPSNFSKRQLIVQFPSLRKTRVLVISNGVDPKQFFPISRSKKDKVRDTLKIPKNSWIISYSGILDERKRVEFLLDVFFETLKIHPKTHLIIAYPSDDSRSAKLQLQKIKSKVEEMELVEKTTIIKNHPVINEIYNISDLTVLLSKEEHFPLTALEAFASGTLFTASPRGALKKLLRSIDPNLVTSSKNPKQLAAKLAFLLELPKAKKDKIIKKQKSVAKKLSWDKVSLQIANAFSETLLVKDNS